VQHSSAVPTDDEPEDLHAAVFTSAVEPPLTSANRQTGDSNDDDDDNNDNSFLTQKTSTRSSAEAEIARHVSRWIPPNCGMVEAVSHTCSE